MINESEIWFNGDAKKELDYETFGIKWYPKEGKVRDFCKTARKPYDILVCFSLLALKAAFHDYKVFNFSSDGDDSDWETAKNLFMDITYTRIDNIFPEEQHLEVA